MEVAKLLRRTLLQKGIAAQELASYLDVHPTLISKWANSKAHIPCYHLPAIARYTNETRFMQIRIQHCPVCTAIKTQNVA